MKRISGKIEHILFQIYANINLIQGIYYMASQIARANNQIQHVDWPKIGPITSHTRPGRSLHSDHKVSSSIPALPRCEYLFDFLFHLS